MPLTIEEIKEVAKEYTEESPTDEIVSSYRKSNEQYTINVKYSDINYAKTRLVQRTPKEASIEFYIDGEKTIVRMPSNDKAKEIVGKLKNKLDAKKKTDIQTDLIEIGEFNTAAARTKFFIHLISKLDGFKLDNVTSVRVEPIQKGTCENELDLEDDDKISEEDEVALAFVKNVALKGDTLLASEEYQSLTNKGFFITSIIWQAKETNFPFSVVEFEAAFDDPGTGKGFKYSIRGSLNLQDNSEYTKTLRPIKDEKKQKLLSLVELTARAAVTEIRKGIV